MAMQMLRHRETTRRYLFRVWLDTTKVLSGTTTPDPVWVREYTWDRALPVGQNRVQYEASVKAETKALCQAELATMTQTENIFADEGQAL